MKTYTAEERIEARKKLPRPVSDFFVSPEIITIYGGIAKKLTLNLHQNSAMRDVVNATLLGLEPEHALETNLHQALPELSNVMTRELVADINDRVFKEAKRRLEQNIVTPEPEWNEVEWGPKPTEEDWKKFVEQEAKDRESPLAKMSYEEIGALAEKEAAERKAKDDAEEAEAAKKRPTVIQQEEAEGGNMTSLPAVTPLDKILFSEGVLKAEAAAEKESPQNEPQAQAVSVAAERLAAPVTTKTAAPAAMQVIGTPVQPVSPPPPPAPQAPRAYKGTDPYREPVE